MVCDPILETYLFLLLCLNPYSTGIWSATRTRTLRPNAKASLNPYSTGIWSATTILARFTLISYVLILILLEYGLRRLPTQTESSSSMMVLILILLEYGLRLFLRKSGRFGKARLNPYSTGIWSATLLYLLLTTKMRIVLILILLEYGLRLLKSQTIDFQTLKT